MARVNDLTGSRVQERKRQVRTYGTKTDLSSTTVDRGDTHWMNSSRVSIDGVLGVTGLTTISGTLNVSGTTTLSGSTTIAGPTGITGALTIAGSMSVTGPSTFSGTLGINGATTITGQLDVTGPTTLAGTLSIDGDTTITGLLEIEGNTTVTGDLDVVGPLDVTGDTTLGGATDITGPTTLKNNLTVDPAKRIILGGLVLENQGAGSAFVQMPGGGIAADGLGMGLNNLTAMNLGAPTVTVDANLINLNAPQTSVNGNLVVTGSAKANSLDITSTAWIRGLPTTPNPPNLHITSQGQVFISSWTPA